MTRGFIAPFLTYAVLPTFIKQSTNQEETRYEDRDTVAAEELMIR